MTGLKKEREKKTRDLEKENGKNQSEKEMRAATDGSALLIRTDVLTFLCFVCACVRVYVDVYTRRCGSLICLRARWQSSGHVTGPSSPACCMGARCVVAAGFSKSLTSAEHVPRPEACVPPSA